MAVSRWGGWASVVALVALVGCGGGEPGPAGAAGPEGPEGPAGEPGLPGDDGTDGTDGDDGAASLVSAVEIGAGVGGCDFGGLQVDSGLDTDGDGVLDASEVLATAYLCAPEPDACAGASAVEITGVTPPSSLIRGETSSFGVAVAGGAGPTTLQVVDAANALAPVVTTTGFDVTPSRAGSHGALVVATDGCTMASLPITADVLSDMVDLKFVVLLDMNTGIQYDQLVLRDDLGRTVTAWRHMAYDDSFVAGFQLPYGTQSLHLVAPSYYYGDQTLETLVFDVPAGSGATIAVRDDWRYDETDNVYSVFGTVVIPDPEAPPSPDAAGVRFINLASDLDTVEVGLIEIAPPVPNNVTQGDRYGTVAGSPQSFAGDTPAPLFGDTANFSLLVLAADLPRDAYSDVFWATEDRDYYAKSATSLFPEIVFQAVPHRVQLGEVTHVFIRSYANWNGPALTEETSRWSYIPAGSPLENWYNFQSR